MMSRALYLAKQGECTAMPNPQVGAVIVKNGEIIGEGYHQKTGSAHAEIIAIRKADHKTKGATCYVTLEPCCHFGKTPPCVASLIDHGIVKVVIGARDPDPRVSGRSIQKLRQAGIQVEYGLMQAESEKINRGFITRMMHGRPWIQIKMAMSLNGKTALYNQGNTWISCEAARLDVQKLRAKASAIMVGCNTVVLDNPSLNLRELAVTQKRQSQPYRVVIDPNLNCPRSSKVFSLPGQAIIYTQANKAVQDKIAQWHTSDRKNVIRQYSPSTQTQDSLLRFALHDLASCYQTNILLVEGGMTLAGSLIKEKLVDEIILYIAPILLGTHAKDLFLLDYISTFTQRETVTFKEVVTIGNNLRLTVSCNEK